MVLFTWSFIYGALAGTSAYITLKWMHDKIMEKTDVRDSTDDCLLFSPQSRSYKCDKLLPCKHFSCPQCNFFKFLAVLNSTKRTLDVCVYLITSPEITNTIIRLFRNGVFVRIIIDKQMSDEAHNSKMHVFLKEHIPIKVMRLDAMMHNKFVIIDEKKVVTGSFNWTQQGVLYNYENGVILHNLNIIKKFNAYFHNMWHSC